MANLTLQAPHLKLRVITRIENQLEYLGGSPLAILVRKDHPLTREDTTAGITGLPVPRESDLSINYALVAHQRTSNSPVHNWLWDQITCTIRELHTPLQRKMRQRITAGSADLQH